jgi:hypothetical protein
MQIGLTIEARELAERLGTTAALKLAAANQIWAHLGEGFKLREWSPLLELRIHFEHQGRWFIVQPVGFTWVVDVSHAQMLWVAARCQEAIGESDETYEQVAAAARAALAGVSATDHCVSFRAGELHLTAWQEYGHVQIDLDETKIDDDEPALDRSSRRRPPSAGR